MTHAVQFGVTLTQHALEQGLSNPALGPQYSTLMTQIGVAGKLIAAQVRRAGLIEIWGSTGETNVQGERVQKLDQIANDTMVEVLSRSGCVNVMASEEADELIHVHEDEQGQFNVVFDPLDGSSNIDVSISIGTIFGIYPKLDDAPNDEAQVLRVGREMIGAGYLVYGSSTVLVYTDGRTVDCFTLDPSSGEYFLTRPAMSMPDTRTYLSINECNAPYWPGWVHSFINHMKGLNEGPERQVSGRHIGSLVSDFHRNLIKGGTYLYPADRRTGRGKLRLLYEGNPLAFIANVAGGDASSGEGKVLSIQPESLHQRCGLVIGAKPDVELAEALINASPGGANR
jgi:fructose-1,6-bisphosphatase I